MSKETEKKETEMVEKAPVSKGIEIEVSDPEIARPKELPLVVKPKGGEWANEAQAEFARTLNGYAYKNPEKWDEKKAVLLTQLASLENKPQDIVLYRGNQTKVGYKNKLIEN